MSTQPPVNSPPNTQHPHAAVRAYHSRLSTMLKNLERDITALEYQFRAGPANIPPLPFPPPPSFSHQHPDPYPSPSLSTIAHPPNTPYLPSLPRFPRFPSIDSQMGQMGQMMLRLPPPPPPQMYMPSMPLMPSMYVPSGAQMRGSWGKEQGKEHESGRRGSENENYDPFRSYRQGEIGRRGLSVSDEQGEGKRDRRSSVGVDQQELYDPLNPLMDHGEHASKPYDLERFGSVSGGVGMEGEGGENDDENEISWEGDDLGVEETSKKSQGHEIEIDYESDDQAEDSHIPGEEVGGEKSQSKEAIGDEIGIEDEDRNEVDIQDEIEAETEPQAQAMEIDYESDDQDKHSAISSGRGADGFEGTAEDESPIDHQSEGQDKELQISDESIRGAEKAEQNKQTAPSKTTRPPKPTSEQFWSQLFDRERTTSLPSKSSKHLDNVSQRHQSIESHLERVEKNLEIKGQELSLHSKAQEETFERLSNQAYSPFRRSPAPGVPSPGDGGLVFPIPPVGSSFPLVQPISPIFKPVSPMFEPTDAFTSMSQLVNQASKHAKKVSQSFQPRCFQSENISEHFLRMNEVLGPISDFAARMQEAQERLGDGSQVVAHVERAREERERNGVWGEMRRMREVALKRLGKMDKDKEKEKGKGERMGRGAKKGGSWREEWKEDLRKVEGEGLVYMLKRVLVDGDGERSEDVVEIEVPVANVGGDKPEGGESEAKDLKQVDDANAEARPPEDPEDADDITQKMDELFGEAEDMEEDGNGFWDGSSDAMNEAFDPEVQEIEDAYAAMPDEYGGMSDNEEEYEEEDDDFLDSE